MLEVKKADYIGGYSLELLFNNGVKKVVDLGPYLQGKIFEPLKDYEYFKKYRINFNTIEWENGADFAPEFLITV